MNLSAGQVVRKWPFGAIITLLAFTLIAPAEARRHAYFGWGDLFRTARSTPRRPHRTVHAAHPAHPAHVANVPNVPLPRPRPVEAPGPNTTTEASKEQPPPQPSACRQALTEEIAIAPSIPAIHGPGDCGGEDLVRLEAIMLPDKRRVRVSPAATLRCPMASEIANWVRTDLEPLAQRLGSALAELRNFESYDCRGFNGVKGAPLSEHGHANALDVHAFRLADGREIAPTDRTQPREVREDMLHSACTRFTTVLGPDSDWHHEDHIHIDLRERHNHYRICQWDVLDPLPKIAPLVPAARPSDAPPRVVADRDEDKAETAGKQKSEDEVKKPASAAHSWRQGKVKIIKGRAKPPTSTPWHGAGNR